MDFTLLSFVQGVLIQRPESRSVWTQINAYKCSDEDTSREDVHFTSQDSGDIPVSLQSCFMDLLPSTPCEKHVILSLFILKN